MATVYSGTWKVATKDPMRVGTGTTDFGGYVTLVPNEAQDANSYVDPASSSPIANWPGSPPQGSIRLGILTKTAYAAFTAAASATVTITIP